SIVFGIAILSSPATANDECQASCPGGASDKVVVDVEGMCMCVGSTDGNESPKCFKVDVGKDGPQMTHEGTPTDKLEGCQGDKYQSKPRPNNGYDNDCLKMGIPGN